MKDRAYYAAYRAAHRERLREYQRNWARSHEGEGRNPQKRATWRRRYRAKHREKINARQKSWRAKRIEERRAYDRAYWASHAEEFKANNRARYLANPEPWVRASFRRYARKKAAAGEHTTAQWRALLRATGHRCLCCGRTDLKLSRDHVIPLSQGGTDDIENIQPLCKSCNSKKHIHATDYRQEIQHASP